MRYWVLWGVLLFGCGCQAFHVTKLYYDEYINPKATIDYEPEKVKNIPPEVLDSYVRIDGTIVRVADTLAKVEALPDPMWMDSMAKELPEVRHWAVFDRHFFPLFGALLEERGPLEAFAASVEEASAALGAVHLAEGVAIVRKITDRGEIGFVVAVLDPAVLAGRGLVAIIVGAQVADGHLEPAVLAALAQEMATIKRFTGSRAVTGTQYRWLLSVRDQLRIAYVYRVKE